jgi:hypothetical protein
VAHVEAKQVREQRLHGLRLAFVAKELDTCTAVSTIPKRYYIIPKNTSELAIGPLEPAETL